MPVSLQHKSLASKVPAGKTSVLQSGDKLNCSELLDGNLAKVIETASAGVKSPEHRNFVLELEQKLKN